MDIQDFFVSHARISRKALARFADIDAKDVDNAADDLGFGELLRLDEAEEILDELDADNDGAAGASTGSGASADDDDAEDDDS